MPRIRKEPAVRFFRADGIEVENLLDLAGPRKDEFLKRIIDALARAAAKRDHLAELNERSDERHEGVWKPNAAES